MTMHVNLSPEMYSGAEAASRAEGASSSAQRILPNGFMASHAKSSTDCGDARPEVVHAGLAFVLIHVRER